ncbi:hypothetical protein [Methanosarcina barkeri]|uniref:hypothetical protein n=1 Tax=Methanosarcina barkeri TaxID=2208 RepID=UPI0012D4BC13|nr:hypothetical protein [Methanosarcina barkeri]
MSIKEIKEKEKERKRPRVKRSATGPGGCRRSRREVPYRGEECTLSTLFIRGPRVTSHDPGTGS